jgi:hypothetical protein
MKVAAMLYPLLVAGLVLGRVKPLAPPPFADDPEPEAEETTQLAPAAPTPVAPASTRPAIVGAIGLLALIALTVVATLTAIEPLRAVLVLAAMLLVPGGTVILRADPGSEAMTRIAVAVALSLAIDILVALGMVWTGFWDPEIAAGAIATICAIGVALHLRRSVRGLSSPRGHPHVRSDFWSVLRARGGGTTLVVAPIAVALALWAVSLGPTDLVHLTSVGVPAGLPATWYAGLIVALLGTVGALSRNRPSGWLIAAYVGTVLVILFATIPAITAMPQYMWTYKHIGVTRLIEQTGTVHPALDIYNRWPGFFATAAGFAHISGLSNPLVFAGWAEPMFAALDTLMVAAIARAFTDRARVVGWAALVFTITNSTGQSYFSPQAIGFVLSLGVIVLVLRQFSDLGRIHWPLRFLGVRIGGDDGRQAPTLASRPNGSDVRLSPPWGLDRARSGARWAMPAVLVMDAALVATHQLTPYMLLAQVVALTLVGVTRPRWLVGIFAVMALAYLAPNLSFLERKYGLLQSFDVIHNSTVAAPIAHVPWATYHGLSVTAVLLGTLGLAGAIRLARLGQWRPVVALLALALAPFALVLGESYGGEGPMRVLLFAAPGFAILTGWGIGTLAGRVQLAAGLTAVTVLAALWLPTFLGRAPISVVPANEVQASEYFYDHAPTGSELISAGPGFPGDLGVRYGLMSTLWPAQILLQSASTAQLKSESDIQITTRIMRDENRRAYLVFSPSETRYARYYHSPSPSRLAALERAVAVSQDFQLWHAVGPTRIYVLRSPGLSPVLGVR